jgi:hypothetical protein
VSNPNARTRRKDIGSGRVVPDHPTERVFIVENCVPPPHAENLVENVEPKHVVRIQFADDPLHTGVLGHGETGVDEPCSGEIEHPPPLPRGFSVSAEGGARVAGEAEGQTLAAALRIPREVRGPAAALSARGGEACPPRVAADTLQRATSAALKAFCSADRSASHRADVTAGSAPRVDGPIVPIHAKRRVGLVRGVLLAGVGPGVHVDAVK